MKRALLVLALVLAAAACGGGDAGAGSSGIRGRALAGPQCPVEVEGSPCPPLPWRGTILVTDTASGERFTAETGADGRFRLALPPGTYDVSIDVTSPPPFAKPRAVTVVDGAFADVVVSVDTGIR
jgi:hypothetical protein